MEQNYYIYQKDGVTQVTGPHSFQNASDTDQYVSSLTGLKPEEVDWYGLKASSQEEAKQQYLRLSIELKTPQEMESLHGKLTETKERVDTSVPITPLDLEDLPSLKIKSSEIIGPFPLED